MRHQLPGRQQASRAEVQRQTGNAVHRVQHPLTTRISAPENSVQPGSSVRVSGWPACCMASLARVRRPSLRESGGGGGQWGDDSGRAIGAIGCALRSLLPGPAHYHTAGGGPLQPLALRSRWQRLYLSAAQEIDGAL